MEYFNVIPGGAMRFRLLWLCAAPIFAAAHVAHAGECRRVVLSGDSNYPPFSWSDSHGFHGSAIDVASKALTKMGIPHEVRYVGTFPQVLESAKAGKIDLIVELKNTSDRQSYLAYSSVPLFSNPVAVFVRSDEKMEYRAWSDLVGKRGVVTVGNKFGGGFDEFAARKLTVETAEDIKSSFAKLESGQSDYYVNSYYPAVSYLFQVRRQDSFKALQPFITATENFMAWSSASPCAEKRKDMDAVLNAMMQSGEVRKMLEDNFEYLRRVQGKSGR